MTTRLPSIVWDMQRNARLIAAAPEILALLPALAITAGPTLKKLTDALLSRIRGEE